ncbi:alpha/beta-hydrolase [Rhizodiscina lignyota]|uniref:Carboxylic ester hydrolase n=1 Tax=Rhizodiscina lignyota TaxID=1504668 RepID=A0A9P4I832_9PEZI|nr:alpha/beta-hydrolase [Rhizodiscina lignyota]
MLLESLSTFWLLFSTFQKISAAPTAGNPTAKTKNGTVVGRHLESFDQDLFLGIPYAEAPRLSNPLPVDKTYETSFDASHYGYTCYGFGSNPILTLTQSEDCLNLNIIRPAGCSEDSRLPVVFWIYGGGYRQGSSADPEWNMTYIVQRSVEEDQPIIAVSINYRLSFLGFPGGQEALDAGITNLGLKDQRQALLWVQENIAAFGGDPRKVTVWGESAGASSIANQLVAYGGKGGTDLFRGGILASGFANGAALATVNKTQTGFDLIAASANCSKVEDKIECLRHASLTTLYPFEDTSVNGTSWAPFLDGDWFRQPPAYEIAAGNCARVPILLGANSDEGFIDVGTGTPPFPNTTDETAAWIETVFPLLNQTVVDRLLKLYPEGGPAPPYSLPSNFPWCQAMNAVNLACGSQYRRLAAILGDHSADAPRRNMAQLWSQLGLPAYSYRFDTNPTALPITYFYGLGPGFADHGTELAYEVGLPGGYSNGLQFYPAVKNIPTHLTVSHEMNKRWISFVVTGSPNHVKGKYELNWPEYKDSASNFVFNATDHKVNIHIERDDYRAKGIQTWIDNVPDADYYGIAPKS